jgi:hypothetical protein
MTARRFPGSTELPELPGLRRQLQAAATAAGEEYDVSTQLVRWVEGQRAERASALTRRRARTVIAVAAVVALLLGAAAVLVYRPDAPWSQVPPAKQIAAANLPAGLWSARITHLHQNPPGDSRFLASVSLDLGANSTGTLRLPDVDEPIAVRVGRAGSALLLEADPAACSGLVLRLAGTIRDDRFVVEDAAAGPCYADSTVASELVGATFVRQEQP